MAQVTTHCTHTPLLITWFMTMREMADLSDRPLLSQHLFSYFFTILTTCTQPQHQLKSPVANLWRRLHYGAPPA
jgi:hypothetical protein